MLINNVTNNLYKLIDNALGRQLPNNVQSLQLELSVDSLPIITVTFIPDRVDDEIDVDAVVQHFEIKELPNVNRQNSKRNNSGAKKRTRNKKEYTKIDIVGNPPYK